MLAPLADIRHRTLCLRRSVNFGIGGRGPLYTESFTCCAERIDAGSRASTVAASFAPSTLTDRIGPDPMRDWSPKGSGGGVGPGMVLRGPLIPRCADCVDCCARATNPPTPMTAPTT